MQPALRKVKILKAVVEMYIATGEPVGSKALCTELDFPVSSATVRNEMAELAEQGLLTQPHTSAGRIPSADGFRLYVSRLMDRKFISDKTKAFISTSLDAAADDPEKILRRACDILSGVLHAAVLTTTPSSSEARIRSIKLVQTGRQSGMIVLITSTGLIKNKLFKCDYVLTAELIQVFEMSLNKKLAGLPVSTLTPAFLQTLAIEYGDLALLIPSVLAAVYDACKDVSGVNIAVSGKLNLIFSDGHTLLSDAALIRFLNDEEELQSFVAGLPCDSAVLIGSDTKVSALEDSGVTCVPYTIQPLNGGIVAAVTPMRVDYAFVLAVLEYSAEYIGVLMRRLLMIDDSV